MQEFQGPNLQAEPRGRNRHLESAVRFLSDTWLPPNPELIGRITAGLKSGKYVSDFELLLKDIKRDVALFSYCIKELAASSSTVIDPIETLRSASYEKVKSIIELAPRDDLRFAQATNHQLKKMRAGIISAAAAESFAPSQNISSDTAYGAALLRQLGITLVAWNYPHIYERVFDLIEPGESLDQALSKMLGFSPALLGYRMAQEWNISPEIRLALGDKTVETSEELTAQAAALKKICEAGEALARASEPGRTDVADWSLAKREILRCLGRDGFRELTQKLHESCRYYEIAFPALFADLGALTQANSAESGEASIALLNNLHVKYCSDKVQALVIEAYQQIDGKTVSRECIDLLVRDAIPEAGFSGGCVYTLDPDTSTLVPRLAVGQSKLSDFKAMRLSSTNLQVPTIAAMHSGTPVTNINEGEMPEVAYVAGVLGKLQRAGVLYLELGPKLRSTGDRKWLSYFKALRQALTDALNLQ